MGRLVNSNISNAIRNFVRNGPFPAVEDFLKQDAPNYEWTVALVEVLVDQKLLARIDQATGLAEILSSEGTAVLRIEPNGSGVLNAHGLMAEDFKALLSAIRIDEVESSDLVMLPPDMRKADLDYLCSRVGVAPDRLRRFTSLWVSKK
jgi:hypothetical protein